MKGDTRSAAVESGDEIQVQVDLASDGSGYSVYADHDTRQAIVMTPEREAYFGGGHIVMVPLREDEIDNWAAVHKHEFAGETCVKVTKVRDKHVE